MPGLESSPSNPLESLSLDQALAHARDGNGSPAYVSMSWVTTQGPAALMDFSRAEVIQDLRTEYSVRSQTLSSTSYVRDEYLQPDEVAYSHYQHGRGLEWSQVFGNYSGVIRGTIDPLPSGKFYVNLELKAYNDQYGHEYNDEDFLTELGRAIHSWMHDPTGKNKPFDINYVGPGRVVKGVFTLEELYSALGPVPGVNPRCFAYGTGILVYGGGEIDISCIEIGDIVACDGERYGRVSQLFRNVTHEWIELVWHDPLDGEERTLTATPGHVMLTAEREWKPLIEMIDGTISQPRRDEGTHQRTKGQQFGSELGSVRLVTASGDVVVARANHLLYSAATAHLYEEAEMLVTRTEGGLAVQPEWKKGWKTYNFEVEKYHTYIANGIRVHNVSEPIAHNRRGLDDYPSLGLSVVYAPDGLQFYSSQTTNANYDALGGGSFASSAVGWATVAAWTAFQEGAPTSIARSAYNVTLAEAKYTVDDNVAHFGWAAALAAARAGNMGPGYLGESLAGFAPNTAAAFAEAGWHAGVSFVESWVGAGGGRYSPAAIDAYEATVDAFLADNPAAQSRSSWRDGNTQANPSDPGTVTTQTSSDGGVKPVLIDLDGDGLEIAAADENFVLFDTDDTGLIHRTAWAGKGDGVLFFDADGDGTISAAREYIFTEWDPTAGGDMEALPSHRHPGMRRREKRDGAYPGSMPRRSRHAVWEDQRRTPAISVVRGRTGAVFSIVPPDDVRRGMDPGYAVRRSARTPFRDDEGEWGRWAPALGPPSRCGHPRATSFRVRVAEPGTTPTRKAARLTYDARRQTLCCSRVGDVPERIAASLQTGVAFAP